jgi:hypothetical protein
MSLIQDALKKAQEQRDRSRESESVPDDVPPRADESFLTGKRKLVYGLLVLVVVIAVVLATVVFKPTAKSSMKSVRGSGQKAPVMTDLNQLKKDAAAKKKALADVGTPPVSTTPSEEPRETEKPEPPVKSRPVKIPPVEQKPQIKARPRPRVGAKKKVSTPKSQVEALIRDGDQLAARRNFVLAVDRYKKALNSEKRVSIYLKLYSSFRAMKNNVLARAYIEEGLKHFPDSFALNKVAAIIHIRAKEFEQALKKIETALSQNKTDYMLLTYKGLCHFHKKDYETALLSFKGSLDLNADAFENYYYIGLIYDNVKNYKKALEFYRVFFSLNPEDKHFKHRNWVINRIRTLEKHLKQ